MKGLLFSASLSLAVASWVDLSVCEDTLFAASGPCLEIFELVDLMNRLSYSQVATEAGDQLVERLAALLNCDASTDVGQLVTRAEREVHARQLRIVNEAVSGIEDDLERTSFESIATGQELDSLASQLRSIREYEERFGTLHRLIRTISRDSGVRLDIEEEAKAELKARIAALVAASADDVEHARRNVYEYLSAIQEDGATLRDLSGLIFEQLPPVPADEEEVSARMAKLHVRDRQLARETVRTRQVLSRLTALQERLAPHTEISVASVTPPNSPELA